MAKRRYSDPQPLKTPLGRSDRPRKALTMTQPYIPKTAIEKTSSAGPILRLEEGDQVTCQVLAIRETESDYGKGHLVDCQTVGGQDFSLPGHAILIAKLRPLAADNANLYIIRKEGMIGRATAYFVADCGGNVLDFKDDTQFRQELERTEAFLLQKMAELPPRD
jgi:hypothetical protein